MQNHCLFNVSEIYPFGHNLCAKPFLYMSYYLRYCPGCRNDASEVVLAGEKLKESKKKSKMASASSSSQRDWGKVSAPHTVAGQRIFGRYKYFDHSPDI